MTNETIRLKRNRKIPYIEIIPENIVMYHIT